MFNRGIDGVITSWHKLNESRKEFIITLLNYLYGLMIKIGD